MTTPNQLTEPENAAHPPGVSRDPFAVDFFGGKTPVSDDEAPVSEKEPQNRARIRARKKSDWYKNLPRITNAEAEFSNLFAGLPENFTETAAKTIAGTLARYIFRPAETTGCSIVSVREVNLSRALQKLNESPKVFISIGCRTENAAAATAALDIDFAASLIDSMLDGQGAETENRRALSPVETAIVEFLAANVLSEINDFIGEPLLYLEKVNNNPAIEFRSFERGAEIVSDFTAGDLKGVVSLLASERFLKTLDKVQNPLFTKKAQRKKIGELEKFARELDLRLQVGATSLEADSLSYLEPGDVVLIEKPQIGLRNKDFGGNSRVFAGSGKNTRFRGIIEDEASNDGLNFKIEEILSEEARRVFRPAKFKMDEIEIDPAEEIKVENVSTAQETTEEEVLEERISPSLENIQVALRVEIAAGKISLRELQNLRAGQIIALGASPTDPVRLVTDTNDEPVATGELVEIEGQLGVRLTKVFI